MGRMQGAGRVLGQVEVDVGPPGLLGGPRSLERPVDPDQRGQPNLDGLALSKFSPRQSRSSLNQVFQKTRDMTICGNDRALPCTTWIGQPVEATTRPLGRTWTSPCGRSWTQ